MVKEKTFLCVIIALVTLLLCTTISTGVYKYKYDRLVSENRTRIELSRQRAAILTDTLEDVRTEAGAIGASLNRQRTSVSELRELIKEVRTRYEKMEELLSCVGRDDGYVRNNDSGTDNACEGKISDE